MSFILGYFYTAGDICPVPILNTVHVFFTSACPCILWTSLHPIPPSQQSPKGACLPMQHFGKQLWGAAWGKGHFYNIVPSITSPFLFSSWGTNLSNVHVSCSWTNSFLSLRCRNFSFLTLHKVGSKTFTKWCLELKLLRLRCSTLGQQFCAVLKYCSVSFRKEEWYI